MEMLRRLTMDELQVFLGLALLATSLGALILLLVLFT
jgi:hypothetical protein